jgi:hypothetical protein
MKVTLWQQFSSNHSNGFSVVGVFETVEDAQKAKARIQKLIDDVTDWHNNNPPSGISEPERKILKDFKIEWDERPYIDRNTQDLAIYDNIVEITSASDSWVRMRPFELLLQKLGADVGGWEFLTIDADEETYLFKLTVSCITPDENTASKIIKDEKEFVVETNRGSITQEGNKLTLDGIYFGIYELRRIKAYLKGLKCTDIEYMLKKEKLDWE